MRFLDCTMNPWELVASYLTFLTINLKRRVENRKGRLGRVVKNAGASAKLEMNLEVFGIIKLEGVSLDNLALYHTE